MPKVKTEQTGFNGRIVTLAYHCDSSGLFTCKLPEEIPGVLGYGEARAGTLADCKRKVTDAFDEFRRLKTTEKKVICYEVKSTCYVWSDKHERVLYKAEEVSFSSGTTLSLAAAVYTEKAVQLDGKTQYNYTKTDSTIPRGMCHRFAPPSYAAKPYAHQMDWTQEREEFFA